MKITEGYMPFMGYQTYYRIVGESTGNRKPLLLLHGGPGSTHNYFEILDRLAEEDGRLLISYDQLGCGNSYVEGHPELWTMETWISELKTIRHALGLKEVVLLGQSWGGMLLLEYVCRHAPEGVRGIVLSSTLPSSRLWGEEQARMIRQLPSAMQTAIRIAAESGDYSAPDYREKIDLPVVIMAGGKGTRLKPITNVIPKPLVPVGKKTILEVIMDQFESIGCHKFYMSVNYKADMMKYYLSQLDHQYDVEFFQEDKPLGTIGSVSLLKGKITTPFFVSNCDSINEQDYRDVYDYHVNNHNDLTIVTMVKSFNIPYGVIETGEDGLMVSLSEKPELTYQVNTGVYILNPSCIEEIPEGEFFHITHLMEKIKACGGRVGCFPVSEHAWKDMGEWPEYLKMIKVL